MGKTAFSGPILGNADSLAGGLTGAPIGTFGRTQWVSYFNDFTEQDVDYGVFLAAGVDVAKDWSLTQVSGGGSASVLLDATTADIGVLRLDCPASADGPIVQLDGSTTAGKAPLGVTPAAAVTGTSVASDAIFVSRYRVQDVSAQGTFVGLAELNGTSAVIATAGGGITSDTHIGFHHDSSGVVVFTVAGDDDTAAVTTTSSTLTDGDWVEVACRATGTNRYAGYIRTEGSSWSKITEGVLAAGNVWDAQMLITLANIGGGTGDDLDVDYVALHVRRDLTA
jgi:hypothetical protein